MRPRSMFAAAALLAFATAVPAQAAGAPPIRPSGLLLTVSSPARPADDRSVLLRCAPDEDETHPEAAAACRALTRSGGSFDRLDGEPRACTRQSDPVRATVAGTWGGRPTHWGRTFANACSLDAATGPVFRF
ncbi:SSI family serine proteinase inhibitor [Streptomyces sp. NBC_00859]|uniref:SSI family serine proteinase inhibitor n=1 Tax=Streptomyces sp. NBC_00859 TaxID=2903682 RepID=UPI00386AB4EC|nr:SSI family serine proteinase inhibitor [Streptomyces sp. NBC_00859]